VCLQRWGWPEERAQPASARLIAPDSAMGFSTSKKRLSSCRA
jgi:hypothetical protein